MYANLYVFSLPDASLTSTLASCLPKVALLVTALSPSIVTFVPLVIAVSLINSLPLGSPETLRYDTVPELSLTVNVGLKVAPRKITNLGF